MKRHKVLSIILLGLSITVFTGCEMSDVAEEISVVENTETDVVETTSITEVTEVTVNLSDVLNSVEYNLNTTDLEEYMQNLDETDSVITSALVMDSVVEITVEIEYSYTTTYRTFGGTQSQTTTDSFSSEASAFFINEEGYMLTNAHVVSTEDYEGYPGFEIVSTTVYYNYADSDEQFTASVVVYDTTLDLAVLKSDVVIDGLEYLELFDITSDNPLYYGEEVLAVGNANGYGISVTSGIISAPVRYLTDNYTVTEAIQIDAAINEGNSGGPLTNMYGTVLGINSFKVVTDTSESLGYAIPVNVVMDYLDENNISYHSTSDRSY